MKIHEYQARKLLSEAGVPVTPFEMVTTPEQATMAYDRLGGTVVVKAQAFAGGRGKAGFVKLCQSRQEVHDAASFMLGNRMVSKQTGPEGVAVHRILVAVAADIDSEYYAAVVLDRSQRCPVVMV